MARMQCDQTSRGRGGNVGGFTTHGKEKLRSHSASTLLFGQTLAEPLDMPHDQIPNTAACRDNERQNTRVEGGGTEVQ